MTRSLLIAFRFSAASKGRVVLLSLLVAVSSCVFMLVSELSRVSAAGLDEAITGDVGRTGQYFIDVSPSLGVDAHSLLSAISPALAPSVVEPLEVIDVLPAVTSECPPYESIGQQQFMVLRDQQLDAIPLPFGAAQDEEARFCFGGQEVPSSAIYLPTSQEQKRWGIGVFTTAEYERVVSLNSTEPISTRIVVVTGQSADQQSQLQEATKSAISDAAMRNGVTADSVVSVVRADTGENIRQASQGIRVVYTAIAWGVLALGALGLLIAQTIVVRQRMWFFGLSRALGADTRHVATLIMTDVVVVVVSGSFLAFLAMAGLQPLTSTFTEQAFGLPTEVVSPGNLLGVLIGNLVVIAIAGGAPALSVVRQDPLDVLEPRHS